MPVKPDCDPHHARKVFWKRHTHTFLALASFWPFLGLVAFLGPLTSGLVFLVDGFGAPLRPLRPAFWFLLRAIRSFCSCSLCSHLCGRAEKEDELDKDIAIHNCILKLSSTIDTSAGLNIFVLYSAEPLISVCYSWL